MADNEKTVVEVDVDLDAIESKLKTIDIGIVGLKAKVIETKASISSGFSSMKSELKAINEGVLSKGQTVDNSIKTLTGAVSLGLAGIVQEVTKVFETLNNLRQDQAISGATNNGFQMTDLTFKLMDLIQSYKGSGNASGTGKGPILLGPGSADTAGDKSSSSTGTTGTNSLGVLSGLGDIASFGTSMDDLVQSIGNVITKLKESVAAWGAQTAAKIADKAEDAAIIAMYVGDFVKAIGGAIAQLAASTAAWVANTAAKAASTAAEWAHIAAVTVWNGICATATAVTTAFNAALAVLTSPITLVIAGITALVAAVVLLVKNWDTVKAVAISTWESIKEAFGSAWSWFKTKVVDPLVNGLKGGVNGIIGFINGLIAGLVKGINSIINMINKLQFAVPDWIPGLGGKTFGFNLKPVTAPQIPYLAKGAVLPANKAFLALVGDQRHGTNIEAPLSTIQEAMAATMQDYIAGNMAGHEATVGVLREILEAVLGIHIGDADIYRAADRYRRKMAVVNGRPY